MRTIVKLAVAGILCFGALQLFHPSILVSSMGSEIQVSPPVHQLLEKDCYSCHSNQRRLTWFDHVVPGYWLVRHDILTARKHLNFSTMGSMPPAAQRANLFEAVNMIRLGAMPLGDFTALHPDAKVTPGELATLEASLAPWNTVPVAANGADHGSRLWANIASVAAEWNGLAFEPDFEDWKPISFTDRGDNGTFRFILANDIAVKAAQAGQIAPWPDGARFAKIAWQQASAPDGLIYPGEFVQVEVMVKDAHLYRSTAGWGWGRWRGLDLKPYGNSAAFTGECVGCHLPLKGADYVYTLPITKAEVAGLEVVNRPAAGLPQSLPWRPLDWNAITMYVDRASHTMSVLFGNEAAVHSARTQKAVAGELLSRAPGSVLALVTWAQRDDPHWFGARIPDTPRSVAFVSIPAQGTGFVYRRFEGNGLPEMAVSSEVAQQQAGAILKLTPAVLP